MSSTSRSLTITNSGAVVAGYQWAIGIGLLLAAVVNNATKDMNSHASWQIPITVQFAWSFVLAASMIFLPESPRWLIKKERDEDAANALSRLISLPPDHPELRRELGEIRFAFQQEKQMGESSYADCFRSGHNKILLRTLTGIFIQAWQQLTGINFIAYYGTVFFKNSGIQDPFLVTIAVSIVGVFMTLVGMWGVEKFGRRKLLLVGAAGMCICEFLIAIIGVTISVSNTAGQKSLIAFVCIYIAFFASTWGPVAWVITSEIFPLNIRAKAMSLSTASNWLWNFGIGYATPYLVNKAPGSAGLEVKVFFIWGSTCAGCWVFTYFCVPEVSYRSTASRKSSRKLNTLFRQRGCLSNRLISCTRTPLPCARSRTATDSNAKASSSPLEMVDIQNGIPFPSPMKRRFSPSSLRTKIPRTDLPPDPPTPLPLFLCCC